VTEALNSLTRMQRCSTLAARLAYPVKIAAAPAATKFPLSNLCLLIG
jgi:hypothetical protein